MVLTAVVRKLALRAGFVARPVEDRFHASIVPLGGGIAIYWTMALFVVAATVAVKFVIAPGFADRLGQSVTVHAEGFLDKAPGLLIVMLVALALHLVGLWDDKKHLGPGVKLAVQFAVAVTAAAFAGIRVEFFIESKIVTTALSAVWIVLIINAFNFLDNMDGLSAGMAAIISVVLFVAAALSGQVFVGIWRWSL